VRYRVIYLWRGERHEHLAGPLTFDEAKDLVLAFRADGWRAWAEVI
jgi:hypothetical protein